jgi:TolB-like protein
MTRTAITWMLWLTCLAAAVPVIAQQAPNTRPGIAVLPFENGGSYGPDRENFELLGIGLQQALTYELAQNTTMRVVDRGSLRALLAEQDLGATERVDPATAARIGRMVGARYVVNGVFMDLFGEFSLIGKIVDVETSEVVNTAQVRGGREELNRLIMRMAAEVTRGVRLPALPAEVREARSLRAITPEALVRHAMIISVRDEGNTDRAIELYRQLISDFPQVEEWHAELRQLTSG